MSTPITNFLIRRVTAPVPQAPLGSSLNPIVLDEETYNEDPILVSDSEEYSQDQSYVYVDPDVETEDISASESDFPASDYCVCCNRWGPGCDVEYRRLGPEGDYDSVFFCDNCVEHPGFCTSRQIMAGNFAAAYRDLLCGQINSGDCIYEYFVTKFIQNQWICDILG